MCAYKDFLDKDIIVSNNIASCILNVPEEVDESCFTRTNNGTSVTITGYSSTCPKNVKIPSKLDNLPVHFLGTSSFASKQITSVLLPDYLISIGNVAFNNNLINNILFPDTLTTIGYSAFGSNRIAKLTIPKSVTSIGQYAFNVNQLSDEEAFIYKRNSDGSEDRTYLVSYGGAKRENVVIPNNIEVIGSYAFYANAITGITIPDTVKAIGSFAFRSNRLTDIVIPSSVSSLGEAAFCSNRFPDEKAFFYKRNLDGSEDTAILVSYGGLKKDNVTIPSQVKIINNYTLYGSQLVSVIIPNGVTTIGNYAFSSNKLTSVIIPSSVTNIGTSSFATNLLTNLTIPSNVNILNSSVSQTFFDSYVTTNARAQGTYTSSTQTDIWTKQ